MILNAEQLAERDAAHKRKMARKKAQRRSQPALSPAHVPANLSRNHPDYGLTLAEHLVRKAERTAA